MKCFVYLLVPSAIEVASASKRTPVITTTVPNAFRYRTTSMSANRAMRQGIQPVLNVEQNWYFMTGKRTVPFRREVGDSDS